MAGGPWGKEAVLAGAEISGKQLWGMEELSPQVPRPEDRGSSVPPSGNCPEVSDEVTHRSEASSLPMYSSRMLVSILEGSRAPLMSWPEKQGQLGLKQLPEEPRPRAQHPSSS